ncbi:MAG: nucleotidyltransferase domain-containing protein [bacterium]|nr:nucleotidyltransferase domain-containing protein [bacterium]
MTTEQIIHILKKTFPSDEEVLFAYLYGSYATETFYPGSDVDVAICLRPSTTQHYLEKETQLGGELQVQLHSDDIDLRILNVLPLLLKYRVLKEGILIFSRDEQARVDFDTEVMNDFLEMKPYFEEYDRMLAERIRAGV